MARAKYLHGMISSGRQTGIHLSCNAATNTAKVKVVLKLHESTPVMGSLPGLTVLEALMREVLQTIVTDRGHSGSRRRTNVSFHLKANRAGMAAAACAAEDGCQQTGPEATTGETQKKANEDEEDAGATDHGAEAAAGAEIAADSSGQDGVDRMMIEHDSSVRIIKDTENILAACRAAVARERITG